MRSSRELGPSGLEVEVTSSSSALGRAARRLLTDTYRRAGLFDGDEPFAFDDEGLLIDDWTEQATVFVATQHGLPVGTSRLLAPVDGTLPALAHADERRPPIGSLEEVSGFAVANGTGASGAAIELIRAMWQHALLRGIEDFVALVEPSLHRYLTRIHRFDWRVVGDTHRYRDAALAPIAFRLRAPGDAMPETVQRFMKAGLPRPVVEAFDTRMRLAVPVNQLALPHRALVSASSDRVGAPA